MLPGHLPFPLPPCCSSPVACDGSQELAHVCSSSLICTQQLCSLGRCLGQGSGTLHITKDLATAARGDESGQERGRNMKGGIGGRERGRGQRMGSWPHAGRKKGVRSLAALAESHSYPAPQLASTSPPCLQDSRRGPDLTALAKSGKGLDSTAVETQHQHGQRA